jgi:hypothetical protein
MPDAVAQFVREPYTLDEVLDMTGPETRPDADRFSEVMQALTEYVQYQEPGYDLHRKDIVYAIRLLKRLEAQSWEDRTQAIWLRETITRLQDKAAALAALPEGKT